MSMNDKLIVLAAFFFDFQRKLIKKVSHQLVSEPPLDS